MKSILFTTRIFLAVAFTFGASSNSSASDNVALVGAEVGEWTMDFDAAIKLSKEKDLPMLLNFTGSDWCGWCKLMDKNVFAGESWKSYAKENVVLVTIDFPRDPLIVPKAYLQRNNELKNKYGIQGYPSYLILDSDGETILGKLGAGQEKTPESFVTEFKEATRLSKANVAAYIKANPDKAEAFQSAIDGLNSIQKELTEWAETGPVQNEENNKIYQDFMSKFEAAYAKLAEFK